MIRTLLATVALAAFTTAAALADGSPGMMPNYPTGVTVYATATATTTDVNGTFTANKTAKTPAQAATVLAAAKTAAGATATVEDIGLSTQMMGGSVEGVRVTSTPADARAIRAKLETAGFTAEAVTNVAKDPIALHAEALAKATKVARAQAEAAASADGRHAGRLLNITVADGDDRRSDGGLRERPAGADDHGRRQLRADRHVVRERLLHVRADAVTFSGLGRIMS